MKEENPGFGVTEVSKKAGEMWAKIDGDTKERFEKKAKAAKEKYEEDYKQWFEDGGEEAIKVDLIFFVLNLVKILILKQGR